MEEEIRGYTIQEVISEARRCLNCPKPMCRLGCPIENDIPSFNHAVALGNFGLAGNIIAQRSNLPAICGRICPHENQCEGHCVLAKSGEGIKIGKIERFIADFDTEMNLTREKKIEKIGGKVSVLGSGPAGLTVAGDLARKGYEVLVYEGETEPGGILLYGIPESRLPKRVVRETVKKIEDLGVKFVTNTIIGTDFTIDDLLKNGFDAVFIGTGSALAKSHLDNSGSSSSVSQVIKGTVGIDVNKDGYLIIKEKPYGMTSRRGVFAGGDVVHKTQTVALAMCEAKKVAAGISEFLEAKKLLGL